MLIVVAIFSAFSCADNAPTHLTSTPRSLHPTTSQQENEAKPSLGELYNLPQLYENTYSYNTLKSDSLYNTLPAPQPEVSYKTELQTSLDYEHAPSYSAISPKIKANHEPVLPNIQTSIYSHEHIYEPYYKLEPRYYVEPLSISTLPHQHSSYLHLDQYYQHPQNNGGVYHLEPRYNHPFNYVPVPYNDPDPSYTLDSELVYTPKQRYNEPSHQAVDENQASDQLHKPINNTEHEKPQKYFSKSYHRPPRSYKDPSKLNPSYSPELYYAPPPMVVLDLCHNAEPSYKQLGIPESYSQNGPQYSVNPNPEPQPNNNPLQIDKHAQIAEPNYPHQTVHIPVLQLGPELSFRYPEIVDKLEPHYNRKPRAVFHPKVALERSYKPLSEHEAAHNSAAKFSQAQRNYIDPLFLHDILILLLLLLLLISLLIT